MTTKRHRNDGLTKICPCARRQWSRCTHGWHVNFKHGGTHYRGSLDRLLGRHVETRGDAEAELDKIRTLIRETAPGSVEELRFVIRNGGQLLTGTQPTRAEDITLERFAERYVARVSKVRERNKGWRQDEYMTQALAAFELDGGRLGDAPLAAVTGDDLEFFMQHLRAKGRAASTRNHYVQLITSMFKWATKKEYLGRNPITENTDLKRSKIARRHRRLEGDEEERLIASAYPRLQRLIVAAIETGCRVGELLSLIWADVSLDRGWVRIRAANAKNDKYREIPISTRLRAVLEMARHDPSGREFAALHHVFGSKIGQKVSSSKKAWETAVLKSHGHTPRWVGSDLTPESQAVYREIDLHFHDLRHEAGSRWLEAGMSLHHVKELLGHASISTTDTYLNATRIGLQEAMEKVDARNRYKKVTRSDQTEPRLTRNEGQAEDDNTLIH